MENEIQVIKQALPVNLIQEAIAKGADLEQLEKLLSLQERWEQNEAKKAYNKAMAAFKASSPIIEKDRHVGYSTAKGKTSYSHASLFNIVNTITNELSKHGLSVSWRTKQTEKLITVSCVISHHLGHSEENSISAPADDSGSKNSIQAIGSTISYLQRYSALSILGLATQDMDDDGRSAEAKIDENKVVILNGLISELKIDSAKFLEYMQVDKIEDIPSSQFAKAKLALESRKSKIK
jgi:hypothetical protein